METRSIIQRSNRFRLTGLAPLRSMPFYTCGPSSHASGSFNLNHYHRTSGNLTHSHDRLSGIAASSASRRKERISQNAQPPSKRPRTWLTDARALSPPEVRALSGAPSHNSSFSWTMGNLQDIRLIRRDDFPEFPIVHTHGSFYKVYQIDVCRSDKITNYELRITNCQLREPYGSPLYIK